MFKIKIENTSKYAIKTSNHQIKTSKYSIKTCLHLAIENLVTCYICVSWLYV